MRCHCAAFGFGRGFRIHLGAVRALQRQEHAGGLFRAQPNVAFIALALDEVHAPAVEALVLDADLAFAPLKVMRWLCRPVNASLGFERPFAGRRAATHGAPHAAYAAIRESWSAGSKRELSGLPLGLDIEIAELRLALPGASPLDRRQADVPGPHR